MEEDTDKRMRVQIDVKTHERIHNDLGDAAFFLKRRISERLAADDREGISLEMIACLSMTAFAFEAYVNFVGDTKVKDWNETATTWAKLKLVYKTLGKTPDYNKRPYTTVKSLIGLRNNMAHGKPMTYERGIEAEGTYGEMVDKARRMSQNSLGEFLTPDFIDQAYDDVEQIWKDLLTLGDIEIFETFTQDSSSVSFLRFV